MGINLQNDVGLPAKVRINFAIKNRLQILDGEAPLLGIVAAELEVFNVLGCRGACCHQCIK